MTKKQQQRHLIPLIALAVILLLIAGIGFAPYLMSFAPEREAVTINLPAEKFIGQKG